MAAELVNLLMRWAHIASAAVVVGGFLFARVVAVPTLDLNPALIEKLALRYRFLLYAAISGLIVSGLFNLLTHVGHTPYYHAWFGIKVLLALHVFAASILAVQPGSAGKEAIAKLRALDPNVVAIVSSGYSTDPVMAHHVDYGFRGVLVKPYLASDLRQALSRVLGSSRA